jgi:hypothetical protein
MIVDCFPVPPAGTDGFVLAGCAASPLGNGIARARAIWASSSARPRHAAIVNTSPRGCWARSGPGRSVARIGRLLARRRYAFVFGRDGA